MSTKQSIKEQSKKIKQLAKKYGYEIKHSHALEIISQLAGDSNWHVSASNSDNLDDYLVKPKKISTGISELNTKLGGGIKRGSLVSLAGATRAGKNTATIALACSGLMQNGPRGINLETKVFHINLEGLRPEAILRYTAELANVDFKKLLEQNLSEEDDSRLKKSMKKHGKDLLVRNMLGFGKTQDELELIIKEQKKTFDFDVLVVDYPQLITKPNIIDHQEMIREVFRSLRVLAKEMRIVILAPVEENKDGSVTAGIKEESSVVLKVNKNMNKGISLEIAHVNNHE